LKIYFIFSMGEELERFDDSSGCRNHRPRQYKHDTITQPSQYHVGLVADNTAEHIVTGITFVCDQMQCVIRTDSFRV